MRRRGVAQLARVRALGAWGRRFESSHPDQYKHHVYSFTMLLTVLTAAKSPGISGGLSYESDSDIADGCIVQVPLRNKSVEGIVLGSSKPVGDFDLKKIQNQLFESPLLTQAHIRTVQWMSEYYCCSLRQAMRVFLPSPPWEALIPKKVTRYKLQETKNVQGSKQQLIIDYLSENESATWDEMRSEMQISRTTIKSLVDKGIVIEEQCPEFSIFNLQSSISSILVEGGPKTWESFKKYGLADEEVVLVG